MSGLRQIERTDYLYLKGPYLYFRMKDGKLVPLPTDQATAEFARAYDACLRTRKGLDAKPENNSKAEEKKLREPPKRGRPKKDTAPKIVQGQGTVRAAALIYKRSVHFREELRAVTRETYDGVLAQMVDDIGDVLMADFVDVDVIDDYTEEVSQYRYVEKMVGGAKRRIKIGGRSVARMHLIVLGELWKACRREIEFNIKKIPNPFRDAKKPYKKAKNPAMPWNEDAQQLFLTTAPDCLALGVLMLRYFGQRGSDAVAARWDDFVSRVEIVDGKKVTRWGLMVAPKKGDDREPVFMELPEVLVDAMLAARKVRGEAPTILVNQWGKSWFSARGLGQAIRLHLIKIGLAKKGVKTIHMHGLRKSAAIMAADTDFGVDGIKTVTLHRSDEMAKYYADRRNQERLRSKVIARINEMEAEKKRNKVTARRRAVRVVK